MWYAILLFNFAGLWLWLWLVLSGAMSYRSWQGDGADSAGPNLRPHATLLQGVWVSA